MFEDERHPVAGAEELDRVVFTASAGVHGQPLAEFAVVGVLAGVKDLPRLGRQQGDREWSGRWTMRQVSEQTVLVLGLGGIGRVVAAKPHPLGAGVIGTSRNGVGASGVCEIVRPGATLVNVGRGTVVDKAALVDALDSAGRLRDGTAARRQPAPGPRPRPGEPPHRRPQRRGGPSHRRTLRGRRHPAPRRTRPAQPREHRRVLLSGRTTRQRTRRTTGHTTSSSGGADTAKTAAIT
ncbi:NAD(P)-dependent oxidoreductase [Streptomyces cyaneochromogenes]